jgi:hypothetical protein
VVFNSGKAYHGSVEVSNGKLHGRTGMTDYFFFICPKCENNQVLRILEYEFRNGVKTERNEKKKPQEFFTLAFHIYCPNCQLEDFIKIDNSHQSGAL